MSSAPADSDSSSAWYFDNILIPDIEAFTAGPDEDLRLAYHALSACFHMRDWLIAEFTGMPQVWGFTKQGELQHHLEAIWPDFKVITDAANATKHLHLTERKVPRVLSRGENIKHGSLGWGKMPWGEFKWDGAASAYLELDDGTYRGVHALVREARDRWTSIRADRGW